ncbi:MAG: zinc-binding dehydrogenase [Phycisphaerales bacterium]|nr:zinc-binding dehydrogenase [Phycisphaerales bacterium]
MRAAVITRPGNPVAPNIRLVDDFPDPGQPSAGQVLVRTLASSLNHLDIWVGMGVPGLDLVYPRVSGSDVCGVVETVGPEVDANWVGKRVIMNAAINVDSGPRPEDPPGSSLAPLYELIGEHRGGAHAELFIAPVANLAAVNDDADPIEAAAFGLTFLTAYSMIVTKAGLRPGQSVLITGIGGGVALAAMAIAKHLGCPVCVTSRHKWKLDRAKSLGADHLVLDSAQDWSRQVRDWSGKRGVDLAVDSSGKATHIKCIKSLARGGAYVTPGCTSGPDAVTDLARIFWNQLRILGSTMGTNEEFAEVTSLYRAGVLKPVVDKVFEPADADAAYERLESAEQFGKVVIRWGPRPA